MQVESTRMYRVREVAEHFDVSAATIYRAIESGQLDALKLGTGTGTLRVTGAAVLAYAQVCAQATNDSSTTAAPTEHGSTIESDVVPATRPMRSRTRHHLDLDDDEIADPGRK
jgi:excisionase family DNA binding protein